MLDPIRQIIAIYCLCDDFCKAFLHSQGHQQPAQTRMSTAEVMTVALVASTLLSGNQEKSRLFLKAFGYIPKMLSKGQLNRRLHQVPEAHWQAFFAVLSQVHQQTNTDQLYTVDSLPVPVCDNIRIRRSRLYPLNQHGEAFRGYIASKKRYFYGLRVHLVMTSNGLPVEVMLAPGSDADISAFRRLALDLPGSSTIIADKGYVDHQETAFLHDADLRLLALQRSNSKFPLPVWLTYFVQRKRKLIETVFSQIVSLFGRKVHAVTAKGFELKVFLAVLAYAIAA
jgi:hypothetical protein